jgi:AraC family transcriptional regulator, regulatory protein of adaptative response / methylated-DNA-[protein]-cysteine methyltransferase
MLNMTTTERDPRWARVVARDPSADGSFVYSVKTTGVYCRPSCPARPARPENVAFHAGPREAERAGFRACKRCKPTGPSIAAEQADRVAALCRFLEDADDIPTLDQLAARSGWSAYHLHRVFKAVTGLTPRGYAEAHRAARVRDELRATPSVTEAIYGAGFNSSGRFYAAADAMLGMTPSAYKKGGAEARIRFAIGQCSLGAILVAASERGVCAIALGDDPDQLARDLQDHFPAATLVGDDPAFAALVATVVGMIEAPGVGAELPLDVRGTAFQQRVWRALRRVPAGTTISYAELARRIRAPSAVRAVAQACGANPVAVAIPCHRVVRSDGDVSGYRWGVERKRALLERERPAR